MAQQTAVEFLENQLTLALGEEVKDLRGLFVVAKEIDKKEKRYSEEEVLRIIKECKSYLSFGDEFNENEWFEQFKK